MANSHVKPSARRDDILVSELEDEVLLYDTKQNKAHALNTTAALVWKECDGDTTLADIAARLEARGVTPGERAVAIALQQLSQAGLLRAEAEGLSRREFGRRAGQLGLAAGLAPLVASVVAPTAMAATSALCGVNKICSTDADCGIPANLCHCTTSRDNPAINVCTPKAG